MSQHAMWMSFRSLTQDQSVKNQKLKPGTVKRIARYALPYKKSLVLFLITVVIDALLVVSTPLLLRKLVDEVWFLEIAHSLPDSLSWWELLRWVTPS